MVYAISQDLQDRLGFTLTPDEDNLATQLIAEAESLIDSFTGKNFNLNENELEVFDGNINITQWTLKNKPLLVVNSVTFNDDILVVDIDYIVYFSTATIKFRTLLDDDGPQNVEINYNWGYAEVPAAIKNICLEMVQKSFSQYIAFKNLQGADKLTIGDLTTQFTKQVMLTKDIERMLKRFSNIMLMVI